MFDNLYDQFPSSFVHICTVVEQNTDDILDNPKQIERKTQSQEELEETVTKCKRTR